MVAVPPLKPAPWLNIIHFTFFGLPTGIGQLAGYTRSIAGIIGIETIGQPNLPRRNIGHRLRLFLEIELCGDLLPFVQEILIIDLRLAVAKADQLR